MPLSRPAASPSPSDDGALALHVDEDTDILDRDVPPRSAMFTPVDSADSDVVAPAVAPVPALMTGQRLPPPPPRTGSQTGVRHVPPPRPTVGPHDPVLSADIANVRGGDACDARASFLTLLFSMFCPSLFCRGLHHALIFTPCSRLSTFHSLLTPFTLHAFLTPTGPRRRSRGCKNVSTDTFNSLLPPN